MLLRRKERSKVIDTSTERTEPKGLNISTRSAMSELLGRLQTYSSHGFACFFFNSKSSIFSLTWLISSVITVSLSTTAKTARNFLERKQRVLERDKEQQSFGCWSWIGGQNDDIEAAAAEGGLVLVLRGEESKGGGDGPPKRLLAIGEMSF